MKFSESTELFQQLVAIELRAIADELGNWRQANLWDICKRRIEAEKLLHTAVKLSDKTETLRAAARVSAWTFVTMDRIVQLDRPSQISAILQEDS